MQPCRPITKENLPLIIHNYKFIKYISKGGFSEIFLIENLKHGMLFAAKVMTFSAETVENKWKSFNSEISSLKRLNYPHIIRFYDHFQYGLQLVLILEYCDGGTLQEEIDKHGALSDDRFAEVGYQLLETVRFCHEKKVAHRDIKASNILFDSYGRLKLADFGLSLTMQMDKKEKTFAGSLLYSPPEIVQRRTYDPIKSDIWSIGVVLYQMSHGCYPWRFNSVEELNAKIVAVDYKMKTEIRNDIALLIHRSLLFNPEERFSLIDMLRAPMFLFRKSQPLGLKKTQSGYDESTFRKSEDESQSRQLYCTSTVPLILRRSQVKTRVHRTNSMN